MPDKSEWEIFLSQYHKLEDKKLEIEKFVDTNLGSQLSGRQLRVSYLLVKLLAHTDTLLNIIINHFQFRIDQKKWYKIKKTRFYPFDHHSICALGRVCFDAGLMLHYISEPSLSIQEWNLRRKVLYLHDLSNRHRFLKAADKMNSGDLPPEPDDKWIKDGIVSDINFHLIELGIDADDRYTNGQMVFLSGVRGAVREAGWDLDEFEFQQVYLSNFVHSHPVSFMRAEEHRVDFATSSPAQFTSALVAVTSANLAADSSLERCRTFLAQDGDPLASFFDEDGMQIDKSPELNL